jgi:hypothetical protein
MPKKPAPRKAKDALDADQLRLEGLCKTHHIATGIMALPPTQALRLVETAIDPRRKAIFETSAQYRHEMAYYPSFLCCLALPAKRVSEPVYVRESNAYRLKIVSAYQVPYGIYPRILIAAISTAVTKRKNSGEDTTKLYLGDSFYRLVGQLLDAGTLSGGRNGNATRFKQQYRATITATIYWWQRKEQLPVRYAIADDWREDEHLLWRVDPDADERPVFMPGRPVTLTLGKYFHQDLIEHSPQIDFGIFRELAKKGGCLPVDLYVWLTYMANGLKKQNRFEKHLSWENLKMQFGASYGRMDNFRAKVLPALHQVALYYRGFTFAEQNGQVVFTLHRTSVSGPFPGMATGTDGGAGLNLPDAPAEQLLLRPAGTERRFSSQASLGMYKPQPD